MNERIELAKGSLRKAIKEMKDAGDGIMMNWHLSQEGAEAVLYALEYCAATKKVHDERTASLIKELREAEADATRRGVFFSYGADAA